MGLVFVWASAQWTSRQKLFVTLIADLLLILPLALLYPLTLTAGTPGPVEISPLAP